MDSPGNLSCHLLLYILVNPRTFLKKTNINTFRNFSFGKCNRKSVKPIYDKIEILKQKCEESCQTKSQSDFDV